MLVSYPDEWDNYMIIGKVRTFKKDTPSDIIEKAKKINEKTVKFFEKKFFNFEEDE